MGFWLLSIVQASISTIKQSYAHVITGSLFRLNFPAKQYIGLKGVSSDFCTGSDIVIGTSDTNCNIRDNPAGFLIRY